MKKSIAKWAETDRPREKMIAKGRLALSDAELIAILLSSGNRDESAVDLAKRLLSDCHNNLIELSLLSLKELMQYKGIGEAKAVGIAAALELGRRRREAEVLERKKITKSKDAFEYIYPTIGEINYEEFWIILLKRNKQIIGKQQIGVGGLTSTTADPKKIFHYVLVENASGFILCHNHPSGNIYPSEADKQLTKNIYAAAQVLNVELVDHIIVSYNTYYSFKDEGVI
jgi:DNA repair protein RadC